VAKRPLRRIDPSIIKPGQVWELGGKFIPIWLFTYMQGAGLHPGDKLLVLSLHTSSVKVSRWGDHFMILNILLTDGARLIGPSHHEIRVGQIWEVNEYKPRGMSDYGPMGSLRPGDKFLIVSVDPEGYWARVSRMGKQPEFHTQEAITRWSRWIQSPG
jgi:hypothetical protein